MRTFITSIAISALIALTAVSTQSIQAQTFTVIHAFSGGVDGATPYAGLTMDQAANLYGTASGGGNTGGNCGGVGCGTVFKLKHVGSGWVFEPLYSFLGGGGDGSDPGARVIFGPDGSLYGTTLLGGTGAGGTVFNLKPNPTGCTTSLCPWSEAVLYPFNDPGSGTLPHAEVAFDPTGNIYGTTQFGGSRNCVLGCGVVFSMTPSGNGWKYSAIYEFTDGGSGPVSGVIFGRDGNLYGADHAGGANERGTIYELISSGSGWTENVLYTFSGGTDGGFPTGLIFDQSGNLYGGTSWGGANDDGAVFELTPSGQSWSYSVLYSFSNGGYGQYSPGPRANLVMDKAGNLYGTTFADGAYGYGSVFKLTPSNGSWTYTPLHDFTDGTDGAYPFSNVVFDSNGNLYGTASAGGTGCAPHGCGVVWEITP